MNFNRLQQHAPNSFLPIAIRLFSSKRRQRYASSSKINRRETKLFAALRIKQQEHLDRLRDALDEEDRDIANENGGARIMSSSNSHRDHAETEARKRKHLREVMRMSARKAVRKERSKCLPLFRPDSPLSHRFGEYKTLLDYENLPELSFDGPIAVIHSANDELEHQPYLSTQKVFGIDTESLPQFDKRRRSNPVCLVQISTLDRAYLYRITRGGSLPPLLRSILEDPSIVKVGHSLDDDSRLLRQSNLVSGIYSTIDTLPIAIKLGCLRPALQTLGMLFLAGEISKAMQVSNWEVAALSPEQIQYAATDAWTPLRVMLELIQIEETKKYFFVKDFGSTSSGNASKVQCQHVIGILREVAFNSQL